LVALIVFAVGFIAGWFACQLQNQQPADGSLPVPAEGNATGKLRLRRLRRRAQRRSGVRMRGA